VGDDRDFVGCAEGCAYRGRADRKQDIDLQLNELGSRLGKL